MKIVTMCRGGNVRSVAAKMILHRYYGHEVIAIGADNSSPSTKQFLFNWADKIVVMSSEFLSYLRYYDEDTKIDPSFVVNCYDFTNKSLLLEVGNDVWGDPFSESLQLKIFDAINAFHFDTLGGFKDVSAQEIINRIRLYKAKIKSRNSTDTAL